MALNIWLAVCSFLVLDIPEVSAFVPTTPTTIMMSHVTTTRTFGFPTTPYLEGVKLIHTLERLQTTNFFKLHRTSQPYSYGLFTTLSAQCSIHGSNHTICVIARPEINNTCTYMCLRDAVQRAQIQLHVAPAQKDGHVLTVETVYFSRDPFINRDVNSLLRFFAALDGKHTRDNNRFKSHPNLMWFRRMVLGLSASSSSQDSSNRGL